MKKTLLSLAVITMSCVAGHAQEATPGCDNQPLKNNITVAATLGYNNYVNATALDGVNTMFEAQGLEVDWTRKRLMVGAEIGWFINPTWKLSLAGGFSFTNNPGKPEVIGTTYFGDAPEMGSIPTYRAVADAYSLNYQVTLGIDRYQYLKQIKNLAWFWGFRTGFTYGLNEAKYDEAISMGKSSADTWALRGAVVLGADYFVTNRIYVGAQVNAFGYTFAQSSAVPQEGLAALKAQSHSFDFLAAPTVKVGFKFGKVKECKRPAPAPEPEPVVAPAPEPEPEPAPAPVVEKPLPTANIFFPLRGTEVTEAEAAKLAEMLSLVDGRQVIYIVAGYADKGTGNARVNKQYAEKRAMSVAKAIEKLGVSMDDMRIEVVGDVQQPFADNDQNRVVIVTTEKK